MTTFLQLLVAGIALGGIYALIALGFTVIYRASQVINFAQGSLLLLGAYLVSWFAVDLHVPFAFAMVLGIIVCAVVGVAFQVGVLRRVIGQQLFTVVMITIGLNIAIAALVPAIFTGNQRLLGDPWGNSAVHLGSVTVDWVQIWTIVVTLAVVGLFFLFDRFSRYGLAMRATASDEEAALAVGVPVRRVYALAWALAAMVATVGGVFLAGRNLELDPSVGDAALSAFPAIILGGLDSPVGAVVGGVVIGVVEVLTAGYQPDQLGHGFYAIAPYIVMIAVLLVKPYGLFGSRPVERV